MQSDADRFRPRDDSPLAEQSPPADERPRREPQRSSPSAAAPAYRAPGSRAPQYGAPQYSAPQYGAPQYSAPQYGAQRPGAGTYGTGRFDAGQRPGLGAQPTRYAPPTTGFAPALDGSDAPLIHPAAAQASDVLPYGMPVYRTPVYAPVPQPQRGLSITALVLGLCSFLFAWTLVVVPIIGIVFGCIAIRREPAGRTMAVIGLVASALGLLWVLLVYLLPLLGMLVLFASGSA